MLQMLIHRPGVQPQNVANILMGVPKRLRRLLFKQPVKSFNDHRCGNRVGSRVTHPLTLTTEKSEHVEASAVREGWQR